MSNSEPTELLYSPNPPADPRIASVASRLTERYTSDGDNEHSDLDDGDLFDELDKELENDLNLGGFRERRMDELKREMSKIKDMRENEHGRYTEVMDEKEVIKICANESRCVVHFYHRNFQRCKIMDKHLEQIAPRYFSTRFIRVFVESVPWLVEKLAIKVLPCVICFVAGQSKDRIIGFEELGNQDGFDTTTLEMRLTISGVLEKSKGPSGSLEKNWQSTSGIRDRKDNGNDDPFDLDE